MKTLCHLTADKSGFAQLVINVNLSRGSLPMRNLLARFSKDESGASLVEYGMLLGLIAVVCIVAVQGLGITVNDVFSTINADINAAL
jgi:pilus assembly protein Flp/PilA